MATYQEICLQIKDLTLDEQLELIKELTIMVRYRKLPQSKHSIMELEGLGKDIWQDIDAQEYVDRERRSWNG